MPHEPKMTDFYTKVSKSFLDTQIHQIQKGAEKYPEPFNPHSWTTDELLEHGMQEAVDLMTYLVGMTEKVRLLEAELTKYKNRCRDYEIKLNKLSMPARPQKSPFEIESSATWVSKGSPLTDSWRKPAYADLDD